MLPKSCLNFVVDLWDALDTFGGTFRNLTTDLEGGLNFHYWVFPTIVKSGIVSL